MATIPMPHGRKVPSLPTTRSAKTEGQPAAPTRKRPVLLALVVLALVGWLCFLAVLAFRAQLSNESPRATKKSPSAARRADSVAR